MGGPVGDDAPLVEQDRPVAETEHGGHAVGHEEDRPASLTELRHLAEALLLEVDVADGEHLVDEQDLGLEVGGDRERRGAPASRSSSA